MKLNDRRKDNIIKLKDIPVGTTFSVALPKDNLDEVFMLIDISWISKEKIKLLIKSKREQRACIRIASNSNVKIGEICILTATLDVILFNNVSLEIR